MASIDFYLFGAPRVERDGRTVSFDTRKATALLAYLLLTGQVHARDSLAALLWPEYDQSHARGALRRTLSALTRTIGAENLLISRETIGVDPDASLWCDVQEFNRLFAESQAGQCKPEDCLRYLERAAFLYRGDFMAGFSLRDSLNFDDWQFSQSESLRASLAVILETLAGRYAAGVDFDAALSHARRWLALDPLREEAHRMLMKLYAWSGQRSAALRQYRDCIRILDAELGVAPLEDTTEVYQAILEDRLPPPQSVSLAEQPGPAVPVGPSGLEKPAGSYPMVGRENELEALLQAYTEAHPDGRIFFIEGEAGIGKTRLAEEFLSFARARGGRVFQARCYEGERELAYGPFLAGFQDLLDQAGTTERLRGIAPQWLSEAARLVPGLAGRIPELPPVSPLEGPGAQARFFEGLRQTLNAALGGDPPGVLFLDDVHWADSASLDFLAYLARRLPGSPVFILITARDDIPEIRERLRRLYAETVRTAGTQGLPRASSQGLHLSRLSHKAIDQLVLSADLSPSSVGDYPSSFIPHPSLSACLYQESEGLPLIAIHYLEAFTQGSWEPGQAAWATPGNIFDLLRSRLAGLDDAAAQLIGAAAVIGRSFDLETLRLASGRSEAETVAGLEALLARRLISEQASLEPQGEVIYDFTHEKLRQLVYQETSLARRRLLHRRVAEVLSGADPGAPPRTPRRDGSLAAVIAGHYRLAGRDEQAAHYYFQAGEHARDLFANQEAIAHFQAALAAGHPAQAQLHESIGDLHLLNGEYREAIVSYETAVALTESDPAQLDEIRPSLHPWPGPPAKSPPGEQPSSPIPHPSLRLARLEHRLGEVHHRLGEWDLAEGHFRSALNELAGSGSLAAESRIYADWSRTALSRNAVERARALVQEAAKLAEESQDQFALAQASNILGILARRTGGEPGLALQHLSRSLEIAETLPAPSPRIAALNNLALLHADLAQYDRAIDLTRQALELCVRLGDRHRQAALHNNLADFYHAAGDGDQAMVHLKQAVALFAEIGGSVSPGAAESRPNPEIWMLTEW